MPERYQRLLRVLCLVLGGVLLVRLGWVVIHHNPLAHLKIPAVPTLATTEAPSGRQATNTVSSSHGDSKSTNALSSAKSTSTNASSASRVAQATNSVHGAASGNSATNASGAAPIVKTDTNAPAPTNAVARTNALEVEAAEKSGSNVTTRVTKSETNAVGVAAARKPGSAGAPPPGALAMHSAPGAPGKPRELAAEIQARVDRITDSEILGPVMHPLPMALLGIAGNIAFLRAPNGQTGLVKEGDDLGGIKLLRIGINRVLVEEGGQKKELMIFSGLGGQSLLTNESKSSP